MFDEKRTPAKRLARLFPIWLAILFAGCQSEQGPTPLRVTWKLVRNFTVDNYSVHETRLTLTNTSPSKLNDNWALYWNQAPRPLVQLDSNRQVAIRNVNGDFYELRAQPGFSLAPGDSVTIQVISGDWMVKEADAPVGLYQVFYHKNGEETIRVIEDYTIVPFQKGEQLTRSPADKEPIPTPEYLYRENEKIRRLDEDELHPFIPSPKEARQLQGRFIFENPLPVIASGALKNESSFLVSELAGRYQIRAEQVANGTSGAAITLNVDPALEKAESYTLQINENGVDITGKDAAGVFYGIQSMLALIDKEDGLAFAPAYEITDYPAFSYRGFHIDVGRNFQTKETILRLLDVLALYKVNKLLFYLTEDEGWRLDIEELPELVEVGARRGHTLTDSLFLQPAYGSGPFPNDPGSFGNGYYTREDFKEILRHAQDRHIEVIPSFNLPGHARAAIKAMEYRYHRLMQEGKVQEALQYRLIDPEDTSKYRSAQYYTDNIACVCRDQAYNFYETVLEDVIEMYREAGVPLAMVHTGGDEVPAGPWTESPICREYLKKHPEINNTRNLQAHFFDRLTRMIAGQGLKTGGWEEVVMAYDDQNEWITNTAFVDREVYPYIWNNLWGQQDLGYRIANRGYPVILCPVTNFYFDLAYNKDPREPGLYWAGFNDTRDAFTFMPYNLFLSTTEDDMGRPYDPDTDFADMERLTPEGRKNIYGLQSQLWSETVRGRDMFEYYILPKLLGFAERAWEGSPPWAEERVPERRRELQQDAWNRFANTVVRHAFPMLDQLNGGYHYRIPPPGIRIENDTIYMNTAYPGLEIRYTTTGSEPDASSPLYQKPFIPEDGTISAKCFNGEGRSGMSSYVVHGEVED
ncbi:MAG: family 20 glycosylhydrolase [Saprospiraceae bacterium]|nr:family 20 glycosylhydrolase [Saprospiraceae bacterium]